MATINGMRRALAELNTDAIISEAVAAKAEDLAYFNRMQMREGYSRTGELITNQYTDRPEYSPGYAKIKGRRSPIDLFVTGEFQNALEVTVIGDVISERSTDFKDENLTEKYGTDIFGLGGVYKEDFNAILRAEIVARIKAKIASNGGL
jgi:hypothetical protein